ncbi:acyl carrier protein [Porticoccus sp. GXU_MW_L64]
MSSQKIREILSQYAKLAVDVDSLCEDSDLYQAGLTSLNTVNIMLAVEDEFDIEFPESALSRETFQSIEAISSTVEELSR